MMRMDLLLNPDSPPQSPVRASVEPDEPHQVVAPFKNQVVTLPRVEQLVQSKLNEVENVLALDITPEGNDDNQETHEVEPAVKRLKRGLPGVRLLLETAIDNQRDDIFSGHAFWGKVPSLNPTLSPSDVSQYGSTSSSYASSPEEPRVARPVSFMNELKAVVAKKVASPSESVSSEEVTTASATNATSGGKKKKIMICKEEGCKSQALSKQLCMKHGGGPRCSVQGCNNGAKLKNLCFQHGGSTICLAPGCSSKAKRFGYCWSHGGGRICAEEDCNKVAAQGGMCWAHGGGNRCKLPGCSKRSYKQHDYYCKRHASEVVADY